MLFSLRKCNIVQDIVNLQIRKIRALTEYFDSYYQNPLLHHFPKIFKLHFLTKLRVWVEMKLF